MSIIGKNIKKIRAVKKISQTDFASLFDLSRGSVGSYEEGRAEPKIDAIIKIANRFGLSIDLLLTKELTVNELYKFDIFKEEYASDAIHRMIVQDKDLSKEDTPLVMKDHFLEYVVNNQNKDYINNLPLVRLPNVQHERTRGFEVSDQSMELYGKGLHPGDILSCFPVAESVYADALPEKVYVVVNKKGIFVRRLRKQRTTLVFEADNPSFASLEIAPGDLLELWQVDGFYSICLNPPLLIEERVAILEKRMLELENYVEPTGKAG